MQRPLDLDTDMMKGLPIQYLAELHAKGLRFALHVNGVDIAEFGDHSADVFSARLNVWLKQGQNTLSASFQPLGSSSRSSRLKITSVDRARNPTELFDSGETGGASIDYAVDVVEHTGSVLERLGPQDSLASESPRILAVVAELHQAFVKRDFERIVELQKVQLEEKSTAVGISPSRSIEGYREFIEEVWSAPGAKITPFAPVAKATGLPGLIQVVDRSGAPAITVSNGEVRLSINPYLAKMDGSWTIVR